MGFDKRYLSFYLDGREAKLKWIRDHCASSEQLVDYILAGEDLRDAIGTRTRKAAETLGANKRFEKKWIASNKKKLDELNDLDWDPPFQAYLQGLGDELAYTLEDEVLGHLGALSEGDDSADADGDEPDDDEDDDEDPDDEDDD